MRRVCPMVLALPGGRGGASSSSVKNIMVEGQPVHEQIPPCCWIL